MRWIFRFVGLIVLVAFFAVALFFLLPADRIADLVEDRFKAATGRALTIEGDIRPGLWPEIGVKTGRVTIANADWASETTMVEAEALSIGIAWQGIFGGDIRITEVELTRPVIRLVRSAEGAVNWEIAPPDVPNADASTGTAPEETGPARRIALDRVQIIDGEVVFEAAGSAPMALSGIDATLALPDIAGPATLEVSAVSNGERLQADIDIENVSSLLTDAAVPVTIDAQVGDGLIGFVGAIGLVPVSAQGQVAVKLGGLGAVTRAAGMTPVDLPDGLGSAALELAGVLTYSGETLSLRESRIRLDNNRITGDLDLALAAARPRLTATLSAGNLDFSGSTGAEASGASAGAGAAPAESAAAGWSTAPIDVSGLGVIDADISLSVDSIALSTSQFGKTRLRLALDDRRLVTTIRELLAYDGQVAGQVVVNGRGGLSASADLSGSAIAISRLFAELLDFDRLIALGDMEIAVLAVGNSMNALMNSMDGDGSFRFGAGELLGLDLVGMIRNLDTSHVGEGSKTVFDEVTGTFRIEDGVVINENLKLKATHLTASGAGRVSLGGKTLNYRIVPRVLSGKAEGVSVPVIISGTWGNPKIRLDLAGLIEENAQEEIEAAKDQVEERAKQKVLEELDAVEGVSPEEALKDKLEDELKKGLQSLFD